MNLENDGSAIPFSIEGYPFLCTNCGARGTMEEDDEIVGFEQQSNGTVPLQVICPRCAHMQRVVINRAAMSKYRQQGFDRWLQDRFF